MSLFAYVGGTYVPADRIRLREGSNEGITGLTSAADGSGSQGGIILEDGDKTLTVTGWQSVVVNEPDCTSRPRLFTGYVADRTTSRGRYVNGSGRQIDMTINDQNVLLSLRLITGADGKRPAETRAQRGAWLLASDYLSNLVYDVGWINWGVHDFEEADYRGQYPADVLSDLLETYQIFFAKWDETTHRVGLFYDVSTATTATSSLRISNDPADVDSTTTFYPLVDAALLQDPSEVYSKVRLTYAGGVLTRSLDSTATAFFPSPLLTRGVAVDISRIGKATTASNAVNAILAEDSTENPTVTCTVLLPSTKVGLIDAGDRISVKFRHLEGYETFAWTRVTTKTIRQVEGDPSQYEVSLTFNTHGLVGAGGGGGGPSNPPSTVFPPAPPPAAIHFYSGNLSFQSDGYGTGHISGTGAVIPNTTNGSSNTAAVTFALGTTYNYSFTINQTGGDNPPSVGLLDDSGNSLAAFGLPTITGTGSGLQTFTGTFTVIVGSVTNAYAYFNTGALGHPPGGRTTTGIWVVDPVGWDDGTTPVVPAPGQWVYSEVPTPAPGSGRTTFSTAYAFATGSLRVWVDEIDQTEALTSTSGTGKTFTLAFDPRSYEIVKVDYQAL